MDYSDLITLYETDNTDIPYMLEFNSNPDIKIFISTIDIMKIKKLLSDVNETYSIFIGKSDIINPSYCLEIRI